MEQTIKKQDQKDTGSQITEGVIWQQLLLFFFPILFGTFFSNYTIQWMPSSSDALWAKRHWLP